MFRRKEKIVRRKNNYPETYLFRQSIALVFVAYLDRYFACADDNIRIPYSLVHTAILLSQLSAALLHVSPKLSVINTGGKK